MGKKIILILILKLNNILRCRCINLDYVLYISEESANNSNGTLRTKNATRIYLQKEQQEKIYILKKIYKYINI